MKKKTLSDSRCNVNTGKHSLNNERDVTPCERLDRTSAISYIFCLVGVSLLSLTTRLYNLHQPASVWLVWLFGYRSTRHWSVNSSLVKSELLSSVVMVRGSVRIIVCWSWFVCTTSTVILGKGIRLRNDLYCVEWGVKLYSLTLGQRHIILV